MKAFILIVFLAMVTFHAAAQEVYAPPPKDSLQVNAENFLNYILGEDFKKKHLKFLIVYEPGVSVVVYETKAKPRADGKNTLFVHFKYLKAEVDSARFTYTKKDILRSIKGKTCNLLIGQSKAKEIARAAGLPKGINEWTVSAFHFGPHQAPTWGFSSTDYDGHNGHGHGSWMNVNMVDGTIEQGLWNSIP